MPSAKGDPGFLNWLNLFIDQIKIDGTLNLLAYEYFERMSWTNQKTMPDKKMNRAQLLKNKFMIRKQSEIEKRLQQLEGTGDKYE